MTERDATTSQLSMQTPTRQPAVTEPAAGCAAELASPTQPLLNNADMTTGGKRAMETPTEPTRQLISTASPPSEPTPTTQEAALRLNSFVQQVQVMRPTPIIAAPPNHKEFSKVQPPVRSRRIAAQRMDHIPASKRGEVLLMRRTGLIPANVCISEDLRECLSSADAMAFDDMMPAVKPRGARGTRGARRPLADSVPMSILSWNVRGLNAQARRDNVRTLVEDVRPWIVCLQETKLNVIDTFLVFSMLGRDFQEFAYLPAANTRDPDRRPSFLCDAVERPGRLLLHHGSCLSVHFERR